MATLTFGNTGTRPYGILTVVETETNITNNTSSVYVQLVLKRPYYVSSSATKQASCTINGTVYNWSGSIGGSGDLLLISQNLVIPHNADGSKTINIAASIQLDITWSDVWVGTISGNSTMQLITLPVNKPTIGNVTYQDVKASTIAITGNNQQIIQGLSLVKFNVTGIQTYYASIQGVTVSVNGTTYNLTVSGSTATNAGIEINSASDVEATITVTDTKGLSISKTINITMLAYNVPSCIINAQRQSNYYTQTSLTVNANYSNIGSNAISITYACTEDTGTLANVSGSLEDGVETTIDLDNNYSWTIWVHLIDTIGSTSSYKAYVQRGMPIMFWDTKKQSLGINCFPVGNKTLEVNGKEITTPTRVYLSGSATTTGTYTCTGLAVTIPKGNMYVLSGCIAYNKQKPVQVALSTSSSNGTYARACNEATQTYAPLVCTGTDYASEDTTLFLWAKWAASSSNNTRVYITGYYMPV